MLCTAIIEPVIPALMQPLIDKSLIGKDPKSLWQIPLFIFLAFTAKGVADYISAVSSQYVALRTMSDLRQLVFARALDLPMSIHESNNSGYILSKITYDTAMVGEAVSNAWIVIVRDSLVLLGLLSFLFYTAWQLTLVVLITAPVVAFVLKQAATRMRTSNGRLQVWMGALSALVTEALLGLKEIKIFNYQGAQETRFSKTNLDLRREQMRIVRLQALNVPLVQILAASTVALVIFIASGLSSKNLLTPGEFVAFITAMSMVFEPLRRLTNVNAILQKGMAGAQSVFSLLDESGESDAATKTLRTTLVSNSPSKRKIEFIDVSYGYSGKERDVLKHFNLTIEPGESVAITGPSGIGKSTLLFLVAKFGLPRSGQIKVGNVSLVDWPTHELREHISLVSQNIFLFDGSIKDNILMGKQVATDEEIVSAAKAAHAWEFIEALPLGLNTQLGSLGNGLSGGQRQRIALTRAFLKGAPILLLDEPTSALDRDSEQVVVAGLKSLMIGRTTILVSHNPDTLISVDRVISLNPGL
jgi:subfamily B ATP-binding cassette protein MsbA